MTTILATFVLAITVFQQPVPADSISLQYAYDQAAKNYPTAQKIELQKKITALNVRIANTGYFPNISVNGQATYQSEVMELSQPGMKLPEISKDHYETSLEVTQNLFSGGMVGIRKELEEARGEREIESTNVDLHKIRAQVDQVYFGILLAQQQSRTIALLMENLRNQLETVTLRVKNGVLLPSQQHILEAELIKTRQDSTESRSHIKTGYQVLSEIIGEDIPQKAALELPEIRPDVQMLQPARPEYDLFQSTRNTLESQRELAEAKKMPSLYAFGMAAYGRPGYNFFDDDFHEYYLLGLRLRWNIKDFVNSSREMQALQIQQKKVRQDQYAFDRQLNATLVSISERIVAIRENMERDRKVIQLREQIVEESSSQLANGVITATEYVTELTRASRARLSLFINKVKLSQAQAEYATALGIPYLNDQSK